MSFQLVRSRIPVILLCALLLGGLGLRAYDLEHLPNGLHPDEAKNGYQSYALLKTGRVMEGHAWPLMIPYLDGIAIEPLYVYATIPVLAVADLSVASTRLVAAIAGMLTILAVFLLGRELFDRTTGLVAAALVCVSPWLFPFGRIAFGATLMPPLMVLALYGVVRAARDPRWILPGAVLAAAMLFGIAEMSQELATEYAKGREQFGRPVGGFQAVKHMLADMFVRQELCRSIVYAAGATVDTPEVGSVPRAVAAAKLMAGEAAMKNARACIQVHGGMGYTWEVPAHYYLKRTWVLENVFGGVEDHADAMAEQIAPA